MLIAYAGAGYHGWQSGRSGNGVADHLAQVLCEHLGVTDDLVSSSRTDSGVHAHGLVAHTDVPVAAARKRPDAIRSMLNAHLPADIRVREVEWVEPSFHARFGASAKQYRYTLWNEPVMHPLWVGRAWHVPQQLDLAAMREAAALMLGRHDFRAFTSKRDGVLGSSLREVRKLAISRAGGEWTITIEADGFLYKMCRAIVGTLVHVGRRKMAAAEVAELLVPAAARTPGVNAPAEGLVLWEVKYGKGGGVDDC